MTRIFDFHSHAYPPKIAGKSVDFLNNYYHIDCHGDGTMEDLISSARDADVTCLLVHAVATKPNQVENVNSWIAEHVNDGRPEDGLPHTYGFGSIHPDYPHIARELRRIKELGLLGLKLHPDFQGYYVDAPSMDAVYGDIEGVMPVLVHAGDADSEFSDPERVAHVLDKFPKLTVIAAHLGGYSEWDKAEKFLIGRDLYIDTSSSLWAMPPEKAVSLIRRHGVDRVLFGTDYPLARHNEELERFYALDLTEEEKGKILFENAARLLKLEM